MSLQVNGNAGAVNWDALLGKLGEVTKTEGADGVAGSTNVTITRTVDGVETPVTIRIPDDLDIPETVDQAAIDSLCQKLAADTSLNLTEEQIKLFHDTLSETLTKTLAAMPKDSAQSNIRRAMFDLYKMMALLVEVAQKQRDATREMRLAENLAVQKSILDQAAAQRSAAVTGMIAGAICCALQSAATFISLYQQAKAFNAQLGTEKTAGLDVASKNVDMMKAANNQGNADKQLAKVQQQIGGKPSLTNGHSVQSEVETGFDNSAELRQAQAKFTDTGNALQSATEQRVTADALGRNADNVTPDQVAGLDAPEFADLKSAVTRLDNAKTEFANAKEQLKAQLDEIPNLPEADKQFLLEKGCQPFESLSMADKGRLMDIQRSYPATRDVKLTDLNNAAAKIESAKADIVKASDEAYGKFSEKIGKLEFELETAKQNLRAQIKLEVQKFESSYDSALKDYNEAIKTGSKADIKAAEAKLDKAQNQLTYARAYGNAKLMQPGLTDSKAHLADVEDARSRYLSTQQTRANSVDYINASNTITKAQAYNSLIAAIGSFGQNFVQNWSQLLNAEATKMGAQQKKSEEELDQTKDLFNQAEELVNNVVQLMNSVRQAEMQSMRDAIQA
ncbi:MAG: hypothetical protein IJG18_12605 [Kiritimatiellae bacterium]|nr:hypothetical protein [Kiritimatiellia bacterium]